MNNELKELIELANLTGPSGQEYRVARYLEPELVKYGYEIKHDALGNLRSNVSSFCSHGWSWLHGKRNL